ncbi:MAG: hypothetical protein ACXWLE_12040 [Rhizomicrobium sp.]
MSAGAWTAGRPGDLPGLILAAAVEHDQRQDGMHAYRQIAAGDRAPPGAARPTSMSWIVTGIFVAPMRPANARQAFAIS